MIQKAYNGWSASVRTVRGSEFYSLVRKGDIPRPESCELCGSTSGLTYHAEEYGSTWEDYLRSCHALCCYCHATMHVRWRYPNRWGRFVTRVLEKSVPAFPYKTMSEVYGAYRTQKDLSDPFPVPESDHWLSKMPVMGYDGPAKVALVLVNGVLAPDPKIYALSKEVSGVRYDSETLSVFPYSWSPIGSSSQ